MEASLDLSFLLAGGDPDPSTIEKLRAVDLDELRGALATYLGDDEIDAELERIQALLGNRAPSLFPRPRAPEPRPTPPAGAVEVTVLTDDDEVARRAADLVESAARSALDARGRFSIALSGGSTPKKLYAELALRRLPWDRITVCFADERAVPKDHADSNFKLVDEILLGPAKIPGSSVLRVDADDGDAERAAASYQKLLHDHLGADPRIDLVVLGMGDDGHTASHFPGQPMKPGSVVATEAPPTSPVQRRVTLGLDALALAREVLAVITGTAKAERAREVLSGDSDLPLAKVLESRDRSRVLLDQAAASQLSRR
ncbi:MAG: 6-phosphogluconolactonase [Deltaproteobacteria bacterium]|nr:6-phosphogluconolactonase [Deltaproteobacteria bacterium]